MSTEEEYIADEQKDFALSDAHNNGAADYCVRCGNVFHDSDLEKINGKLHCADCAEKVCAECAKELPMMLWGQNNTSCYQCKQEAV